VGFRPFVYQLAHQLDLPGWVLNSPQGVFIEVEGENKILEAFVVRLQKEKPERSSIQSLELSYLDPIGMNGFEIRESENQGERTTLVLPDIATCEVCLGEVLNPKDRRYLYPFANCTHCGPRFTLIESLPYDRAATSMKRFEMCEACRREYEDPRDRRFHAQPIACPDCGPVLELWDGNGETLAARHQALMEAAETIRCGEILAVKGLGGFHLVVDAGNEQAVTRLRRRKNREEKPLALMFPKLVDAKLVCEVSDLEERILLSPESPIVVLRRRSQRVEIAPSVAPKNPFLGVMLPYTPLHHLLMNELGSPVVATSGNLSDEPICIDEREATERLRRVADRFLVHDRPILRHVDDSVVRVLAGRELILRRARGYAPLPLHVGSAAPGILAVGGHLKNTVAVTVGDNVFLSQHIGDLETSEAYSAFRKVIASFQELYGAEPERVAADMHPDYLSTKYAADQGLPMISIQHHYAHVVSCMAENELEGRVLGVAWDGTGYGLDGTLWGGEFLLCEGASFQRVAKFRDFRLPGGERAIKEPRRAALGALHAIFGDALFEQVDLAPLDSFTGQELVVLRRMLAGTVNSPATTSAGRLFDVVASVTGLRQKCSFEGQAAMELEYAIEDEGDHPNYPFVLSSQTVDWEPTLRAILTDVENKVPVGKISARFHRTLAEIIVDVARQIDEKRVLLTGGCFQNVFLTERAIQRLEAEGFRPYWHQRVPPNDGGLALGQAVAASYLLARSEQDVPCSTRKAT
jgi:hydrogenase maturation protein HypF